MVKQHDFVNKTYTSLSKGGQRITEAQNLLCFVEIHLIQHPPPMQHPPPIHPPPPIQPRDSANAPKGAQEQAATNARPEICTVRGKPELGAWVGVLTRT